MKKVKKLGWIIALSVLSFGIFVACATRDIHDSPIFSASEPTATVSEDSFSSGTSPNASNSSPSSDAFSDSVSVSVDSSASQSDSASDSEYTNPDSPDEEDNWTNFY